MLAWASETSSDPDFFRCFFFVGSFYHVDVDADPYPPIHFDNDPDPDSDPTPSLQVW